MHDDPITAPDATTLEDRFKTLIVKTENDIKNCSNTCDAYAKKRTLAKVFLSPLWDVKLVAFVDVFSKRKDEFEYALTIHTALGVDDVRAHLRDVDKTTRGIDDKLVPFRLLLFFCPSVFWS
jgi:hypothetical protein